MADAKGANLPFCVTTLQRPARFLKLAPVAVVLGVAAILPTVLLHICRTLARKCLLCPAPTAALPNNGPVALLRQFLGTNATLLQSLKLHGLGVLLQSAALALWPRYAFLYQRVLSSAGFNAFFTRQLLAFLCAQTLITQRGNMQVYLRDNESNLSEFYAHQNSSVQTRMMTQIPKAISKEFPVLKVRVRTGPCVVSWQNLGVELAHACRYNMDAFSTYLLLANLYLNDGTLTEYLCQGRLLAQCLSIQQGDALIILQYGCLAGVAHGGLYFYNLREHFARALSLGLKVVCGTGPQHNEDAMLNAGFEKLLGSWEAF